LSYEDDERTPSSGQDIQASKRALIPKGGMQKSSAAITVEENKMNGTNKILEFSHRFRDF
jgi:hypothetical protein